MVTKPKAGPAKKKAAKPPDKKEQKTQRERFIEAARMLGADESGKKFDSQLWKIKKSR
jgi:hypothetical protein